MGTRKAKEMASGPMFYERVARVTKHQAPGVADHEVNTIGICEMDSRAYTYCDGKTWRLISMTGQLCGIHYFKIHVS